MTTAALLHQLRAVQIQVTVVDDNLKINGPKEALTPDLLQEIRRNKADLIAWLTSENIRFGAIPKADPKDCYDVSSAQKRIWLTHQINGSGRAYHMPFACRISGPLHEDAFRQAWQDLARRHESLRTVFRALDGIPYQVIQAETGTRYVQEDIRHLTEPEKYIAAVLPDFVDAEFDLAEGPLWRVNGWRVADQEYVVSLVMHHIIADGWSMDVLMRDVFGRYDALLHEEPKPIDPLSIQYGDFVEWEKTVRTTADWAKARSYWLNQLAGDLQPVNLGADASRSTARLVEGICIRNVLTHTETETLRAFARQQDISLYVLLLTTLNVLLYQYANATDIVIGCPAAGRTHWQLDDQIGLYVNTLPIRNRVDSLDSFADLLEQVKQTVVQGYEHQAYGLDDLVDELKLPRRSGRGVLFDLAFTMQNEDLIEQLNGYLPDRTALSVRDYPVVAYQPCKFDWLVDVQEARDTLTIDFTYDQGLFDAVRMERLMKHLGHLLQYVSKHPHTGVSQLPALPGIDQTGLAASTVIPSPAVSCIDENTYKAQQNSVQLSGGAQLAYEKRILAIWQKILLQQTIRTTDDFFQVGGNSLKMVVLHSELQKEFPQNGLALADLFKYTTIQSLSNYLSPSAPVPGIAAIDV